MEQTCIEIGSVQYLVERNYVGERNAKELVLERMLSVPSTPQLDSTPPPVLQ